MSIIEQIRDGLSEGRAAYSRLGVPREAAGEDAVRPGEFGSELACCDNTAFMKSLLESGMRGSFRQIYIDPPFFTRSKFNAAVSFPGPDGARRRVRHLAFDDRFESDLVCYIENMTVRLLMMRDLLSDDGTIWVHLDWHSSHYIRLVLDEIMGSRNFVNEIIWCYKSGGSGRRHFSRKHDTILVYGRTPGYRIRIPEEKSYNRGFRPYNFSGVREYQDEEGWYTLVNMKDVWNIDMVGRTSAERTGYATQKPEALMRRILEAGSEPGDLVGDFFCGSGSYLCAAEALGRRWAGCDSEQLAFSLARKRLLQAHADLRCPCDPDAAEQGRMDVNVSSAEPLEGGGRLIRAGITGFTPLIDTGYIKTGDRQYVEEAAALRPIGLIDYIMADTDWQASGTGFRCCRLITEDPEHMTISAAGRVRLIAADIFGREYDCGII